MPLADRRGELFAGTLVVRGAGVAEVTRTGARTEMGRIASALGSGVKGPLAVELARCPGGSAWSRSWPVS